MKFIVETNEDIDKDTVNECLHDMTHYDYGTFKVTELPTIPEVKMVETGILMSPAEICKCDKTLSIDFTSDENKRCVLHDGYGSIGKRIVLSDNLFPSEFYRDIQKTWDFASIPAGSLIEVKYNTTVSVIGYITDVNEHHIRLSNWSIGKGLDVEKDDIQSIRIIELQKDGE